MKSSWHVCAAPAVKRVSVAKSEERFQTLASCWFVLSFIFSSTINRGVYLAGVISLFGRPRRREQSRSDRTTLWILQFGEIFANKPETECENDAVNSHWRMSFDAPITAGHFLHTRCVLTVQLAQQCAGCVFPPLRPLLLWPAGLLFSRRWPRTWINNFKRVCLCIVWQTAEPYYTLAIINLLLAGRKLCSRASSDRWTFGHVELLCSFPAKPLNYEASAAVNGDSELPLQHCVS